MSGKNIVTQTSFNRNGQAKAFTVAFCPQKSQHNIIQAWSLKASEAINTLIDFRSAIHRWQAAGVIDDTSFNHEVEELDNAGLSDWFDGLIALAMINDNAEFLTSLTADYPELAGQVEVIR